jgi:hypothetical protein
MAHENFRVYGADKIWTQLNREGSEVARCTVERQLGIQGARTGGKHRTTIPADHQTERTRDLVERDFSAPAPTVCGCAISPTCALGQAWSMSPSSSTATPA